MAFKGSPEDAKTRVLLAIWDRGGASEKVAKGQLRLARTGEKVGDYDPIFEGLESEGAISWDKKRIGLTPAGVKMLNEHLQREEFEFGGTQVGSWVANALLKWIREGQDALPASTESDDTV